MYTNETPETSISSEVISSLALHVGNFPAIQELSDKLHGNSSIVFIAQSLSMIEGELSRSPGLVTETLTYLDMMGLYSLMTNGQPTYIFDRFIDVIISNRTFDPSIDYDRSALAKEPLDDFIFSTKEDLRVFLITNKYLVAIYTYMLIATISMYNQDDEE